MNYDQLISQSRWLEDHHMQHGNLIQAVRYNMLATRLVLRLLRKVQNDIN